MGPLLTIWVLVSIMPSSMSDCPRVMASRGHIILSQEINCTFSSGSLSFQGTVDKVPGRWYGVIQYSCGTCQGSLVSSFTSCDECFFCTHNEMISTCQSLIVPSLLAFLLFVVSTCLSVLVYRNFLQTGAIIKALAKCRKPRPRRTRSEIEEGHQEEDVEAHNEASAQPTPNLRERELSRNRCPLLSDHVLVASMVVCILGNGLSACTIEHPISSVGQACFTNGSCLSTHELSGSLSVGEKLCVVTGSIPTPRMSVTVIETGQLHKYEKIYSTSSLRFESSQIVRCKGAGDCSQDGRSCISGNRTFLPKELHDWTESHVGILKTGQTCSTGRFYDGHCTHSVACTWVRWIALKTHPEYQVYREYESSWYAKVEVKIQNVSHPLVVYGVTDKELFGFKLRFSAPRSSTLKNKPFLLEKPIGFYYTDASPPDQPVVNSIGDVQLFDGKTLFPWHSVSCHIGASTHHCTFPQLAVDRIVPRMRDVARIVDHQSRGNTVSTIVPTGTPLSVAVSFDRRMSLLWSEAKCEVEVGDAVSCIYCEELPMAKVTIKAIESPGSFDVTSNCSLVTKKLSCSIINQVILLDVKTSCWCLITHPFGQSLIKVSAIFMNELHAITIQTMPSMNLPPGETQRGYLGLLWENRLFRTLIPHSVYSGALVVGAFVMYKSLRSRG
nr:MAG: glycoprotein [Sanya conocephalus maculatus phenuivirus 1]